MKLLITTIVGVLLLFAGWGQAQSLSFDYTPAPLVLQFDNVYEAQSSYIADVTSFAPNFTFIAEPTFDDARVILEQFVGGFLPVVMELSTSNGYEFGYARLEVINTPYGRTYIASGSRPDGSLFGIDVIINWEAGWAFMVSWQQNAPQELM